MENSELQKRVKELRIKQALSQEELADKTGLSLRTIQRIENGESIPRGDTLKRLSIALQSTPDDLIDWLIQEDNNVLKILSLSQLSFLVFPLLGIIIPLAIWILKKDKIRNVDSLGKSILNFQITWTLFLFCSFFLSVIIGAISHLSLSFPMFITVLFYAYNLMLIIINTILIKRISSIKYVPAIRFLN